MIRRLVRRLQRPAGPAVASDDLPLPPEALVPADPSLPFTWVLNNRLAMGPMPGSEAQWQQLQAAGLRSRFSCCYADEEGPAPPPAEWPSDRVALPDHRDQEPLEPAQLASALDRAQLLLRQAPPLYLHCLAGLERSPLLAVGLTARERNLSLFEALDWVRRCKPACRPLVQHLAVLEQVLQG